MSKGKREVKSSSVQRMQLLDELLVKHYKRTDRQLDYYERIKDLMQKIIKSKEGIPDPMPSDCGGYSTLVLLIINGFSKLAVDYLDAITPAQLPKHLGAYNDEEETPLQRAVTAHDTWVVRHLISKLKAQKYEYLMDPKNKEGETPLMKAVEKGYIDIVKLFLEDLGGPDSENYPASLKVAQDHKERKRVKFIGVDVNSKNKLGNTPLAIAAAKGYVIISGHLLRAKANLRSVNEEGNTPLAIAAANGQVEMVRFLLSRDAAGIASRNKEGNTPLALAAKNGHVETVELLLGSGADLESENNNDHTPLELAILNNQKNVRRCIEIFQRDSAKMERKAASEAAVFFSDRADELRLPSTPSITRVTESMFDYLEKKDAIPPSFAAIVPSKELVHLLYFEDMFTKKGELQGEERHEKLKLIHHYLEQGVDPQKYQNNGGYNILTSLIFHNFLSAIRTVLAQYTLNFDYRDGALLNTPLHWAAYKGNPAVVREILKQLKKTNQLHLIEVENKDGLTPLMMAINEGNFHVVELLVAAGAQFRLPNSKGETAFNFARRGCQGNKEKNPAISQRQQQILIFLEEFDKTEHSQRIFLKQAILRHPLPDNAKLLRDEKLREFFQEQCRGIRTLEFINALKDGDVIKIQKMCSLNIDVNYLDCTNSTVLGYAVTLGDENVLKLLLQYHEATSWNINSVLLLAVSCNRPNSVAILLEYGADLNDTDSNGQTALQIAESMGLHQVVECIRTFMKTEERSRGRAASASTVISSSFFPAASNAQPLAIDQAPVDPPVKRAVVKGSPV